jgi:excisionase family DNA binding protein
MSNLNLLTPFAYRIDDAARVSGLSRSKLYELLSSGELQSVKAAGRRLILADDLRTFLEKHKEVAK